MRILCPLCGYRLRSAGIVCGTSFTKAVVLLEENGEPRVIGQGVSFRDIQLTEITTAARGAHFAIPQTSAILDIGGQCTRAIGITQTAEGARWSEELIEEIAPWTSQRVTGGAAK